MDGHQRRANLAFALKLGLAAFAMFGFAYALVPLYDVFCQATGLNGRTGQTKAISAPSVVDARWVTVEFNGDVMPGLPWRFEPRLHKLRAHPGQATTAWYRVKNLADRPLGGRAVPSVTPPLAARYFAKLECFCFSRQRLNAGEEREMPVTFIISRDLPAEVSTLTLSYAFFPSETTTLVRGEKP
ncbi:MAG: cytochrome c oxidase assembly protein [Sulfuricella sp.]|nr:cytochrome c oxidase assembly protein [Sulfuricella sp.]